MSVKLLTEHHLELLRLKVGCTGLYESTCTFVKTPHCWKSYVMAQINTVFKGDSNIEISESEMHVLIKPCNLLQTMSKSNEKKKIIDD